MKKEPDLTHSQNAHDNSFGVASLTLAILGIVFSVSTPVSGLITSIISLVFGSVQHKKFPSPWSKWGKILAVIGIILNLLFFVIIIWAMKNLPLSQGSIG